MRSDRNGPKLLKRPTNHDPRMGPGGDPSRNQVSARSAKEREEEYNRARERIMGSAAPDMQGGRGYARRPNQQGPLPPNVNGRGRGRKGGFRDKHSDDPDYMRGLNRCGRSNQGL